jgi:TonB family protein
MMKTTTVVILLIMTTMTTAVTGAAFAQGVSRVTNPTWLRAPNALEIAATYPKQAFDESLPGQAVVDCVIAANGALRDCVVTSEAPTGRGFGDAAISLSTKFTIRTQMFDGVSAIGAKVAIPIRFWRDPKDAPPPPKPQEVLPPPPILIPPEPRN